MTHGGRVGIQVRFVASNDFSNRGGTLVRIHRSPRVDVMIVDPRPQDYAHLARLFAPSLRLQFAASAETAFRLRPREPGCHWLVNVALPDVLGFDLLRSLRALSYTASVTLVDDAYCVAREVRARMCGAMYACKPLDPDWFAQAWLHSAVSARTRLPCEYVA
jgi:hypothetical protein